MTRQGGSLGVRAGVGGATQKLAVANLKHLGGAASSILVVPGVKSRRTVGAKVAARQSRKKGEPGKVDFEV